MIEKKTDCTTHSELNGKVGVLFPVLAERLLKSVLVLVYEWFFF